MSQLNAAATMSVKGVEPQVVALELGRGLRRGLAREGREALQPVAEPLDEPEVRLEPGALAGRETGRQLAVLAIGEVQGGAAAPAHGVVGRGRAEDPVPGPQGRPLGRQAHAPQVVADGPARLEGGVERQLERGEPVGFRDAGRDELVQRRRDGPRVARRQVGVVAGPGVDPAPVVAVAAGVELGGGEGQSVERQHAPPVRVQRGSGRLRSLAASGSRSRVQGSSPERPGWASASPRRASRGSG